MPTTYGWNLVSSTSPSTSLNVCCKGMRCLEMECSKYLGEYSVYLVWCIKKSIQPQVLGQPHNTGRATLLPPSHPFIARFWHHVTSSLAISRAPQHLTMTWESAWLCWFPCFCGSQVVAHEMVLSGEGAILSITDQAIRYGKSIKETHPLAHLFLLSLPAETWTVDACGVQICRSVLEHSPWWDGWSSSCFESGKKRGNRLLKTSRGFAEHSTALQPHNDLT